MTDGFYFILLLKEKKFVWNLKKKNNNIFLMLYMYRQYLGKVSRDVIFHDVDIT